MKRLLVVLAMLVPMTVLAQGLDLKGLTKEQVAELAATAAKMKGPEGISATARKEVGAWADLGTNIGTALVSAAREVGVAANEFSATSLGRIVTVLIVWKIAGRDLLGVGIGSVILIFGLVGVTWILSTKQFGETKYEYKPVLWGLYNKKVVTEYSISNDNMGGKMVSAGGLLLITLVVGLNCIF